MSSNTTRSENLLEAVPDALVGMDQQGMIRFVNRQSESLFGYDRDQLIGQPIQTLVPETLWQIYTEHQESYFADHRTRSSGLEVVLSGRPQDGIEFPVNISVSHIDTGDVLLVITAVHEVTRQQQAVKNAVRMEAIVECSDDAIIGSTLTGIITSWNPAAERMYGYSSKEITGKSSSLLTLEDSTSGWNAIPARIKAGETVRHLETTLARKDGTLVPVSINVAPILDEDGEVIGACAFHRDVTEQRKTLAAAQAMAAIIEGSDEAIIGRDLNGIITSWNPAAERMYGYSSKEAIGRSTRFMNTEGRTEGGAILAKVSAGQKGEELESFHIRKNGIAFPVSLTDSPIRGVDHAIVGRSTITRDNTENG